MRGWVILAVLAAIGCGGKAGDDSANADSGKDATFADGAHDATSDAIDDDASIGDGACPTPASVDAFAPAPMHPPRVSKGACTTTQIDDAFKACFPMTDQCDAFKAANPTCAACLLSSDTDPTWGPEVVVDGGAINMLNGTGCIAAVTGDSSETSCAQRFDDAWQCLDAACNGVCPIVDQASATLRTQCYGNAEKTVCGSWIADECAVDAGWATTCIASGSNDPEAAFDNIAGAMCGP